MNAAAPAPEVRRLASPDFRHAALAFVAACGTVPRDHLPTESWAWLGERVEPAPLPSVACCRLSAVGAREVLAWRAPEAARLVAIGAWLSDAWRAGAVSISRDGARVGVRDPFGLPAPRAVSLDGWRVACGVAAGRVGP